jgi:hypothetical protein
VKPEHGVEKLKSIINWQGEIGVIGQSQKTERREREKRVGYGKK